MSSPTAHVIAMSELEPTRSAGLHRPAPASPAVLAELHAALRNVKATLTVCVGSAEITVGELLGARDQHVIRLDRTIEQPVDVLLEGQVVARGMLVAVDDHFGVRITELSASAGVSAQSTGQG